MAKGQTEILEFDDTKLVRELCGPEHNHLALIERAYDVYLEAPGSSVIINGNCTGRARASKIIKEIHSRLERGWPCTSADIEVLINETTAGKFSNTGKQAIIPFPRRKAVYPKTDKQEQFIRSLREHTMIFGIGPAGTGKTFLATAYGASLLARGEIHRFVACRPAVEAGEKLGFLPGDLNEKVDPYLQPIWDALNVVLGHEDVEQRKTSGDIEVIPLAFMRGRTLSNAFVVIDEAQNATIPQIKMVLTRLGENAKYVITGDPSQNDLSPDIPSGLSHALSILDCIQDIDTVRFTARDIVRHPLVGEIVQAYEKDAKQH